MKSWHISSAFWITLLFLFASCDTGGAETLSTVQENRINLRIHEYLDGDTSLVGTFSLAGDKAFDISQTKQKFYPTSSSIRALGMGDTKAHTSVPSGALFYVNPINRSLSINHITSSLPGKSTSKNDMIATDTMDGIAFYFFLLERPDVILQDSIMVTYNLHIYTDIDTIQVEEMLYVNASESDNLIRTNQIEVVQGSSLTLTHGASHLLIEFDSNQIDETIFPCLVIDSSMEGYPRTVEFCSEVQPDGKYGAIDLARGWPLTDEAVYQFFLLRKPVSD